MCCCGGEVADDRTGAASLRAPDLAMIQVDSRRRPVLPPGGKTESGAREMEAAGRERMEAAGRKRMERWGIFLRDGDTAVEQFALKNCGTKREVTVTSYVTAILSLLIKSLPRMQIC